MAEIAGLDQLLVNEFTEETEKYLKSLNLLQLFKTLKFIQQKIEQNMQTNSSLLIKTRKSYNLRSDRDNESEIIYQEKMLLFKAYEIIQLIRTRLTNQQLTYRLYVAGVHTSINVSLPDICGNSFTIARSKKRAISFFLILYLTGSRFLSSIILRAMPSPQKFKV